MTLEEGSKGQLLVSYAHTTPPMMGVSCGVENQSLDDQVCVSVRVCECAGVCVCGCLCE